MTDRLTEKKAVAPKRNPALLQGWDFCATRPADQIGARAGPAAAHCQSGSVSPNGWDGDKIAIVLADGNSFGALVKHSGQVYSATGDFDLILKFLKSNSQDQAE